MAAIGCVEAKGAIGELDTISAKSKLNDIGTVLQSSTVFDHAFTFDTERSEENRKEILASCLVSGPWINNNNNKNKVVNCLQSSAAPLTLCSENDSDLRRTLRIDRSGSTESVVTTSGGESCHSSSEPSSPSRPLTPQPMPPVPTQHCPYECLRADSEDSGLGPSPAKSLVNPTSPEGSISPIQFEDDRRSDSLLDLSPRTDNSYESVDDHKEAVVRGLDSAFRHYCLPDHRGESIPKSPGLSSSSAFQFLLSSSSSTSSKNCVVNSSQADYCRLSPSLIEADHHSPTTPFDYDEQACHGDSFQQEQEEEEGPDSNGLNLTTRVSSTEEDHRRSLFIQNLNPKVVLIRSDYNSGQGLFAEESSSPSEDTNRACHELTSDCTSSNCSQAGGSADPQSSGSGSHQDDGACKWLNCNRSADANTTVTDLVDHIRQCHVQSQPGDCKSFVCLWMGCKVYDRPSCSRSWLERHVLLHGGSKPFRCIVDGCRQRFSSEGVLERHVNSHFPQSRSHKAGEGPNGRLCRKRRHKHRKRPQSNKSKDFFDDATMEHVRHNLFQLSSIEGMVTGGPPSAITFHSTIIARRADQSGKVNYLLHWSPEDILPDSWVAEADLLSNLQKIIPVSKLPHRALQLSSMVALTKAGIVPRPGKRKRK